MAEASGTLTWWWSKVLIGLCGVT